MNHDTHGRGARRGLALIGVAALMLFGAVAGSTAASGAIPSGSMPTDGGTLTIHKYEQPSGQTPPATGNAIDVPTDWTAIDNVPFKIERITTVDLNTDAGWTLANQYAANPGSIPPGDLTQVGGNLSTTNGVIGPVNLANGAYLVTELDMTEGNIVKKAEPFVVTVPLPDTATKGWITDIHVYPKNSVAEVDKAVTAPVTYGLGSTITWPIEVVIPTLPPGTNFTSFSISDTLDDRLSYQGYTLRVGSTDVPAVSVTEPTVGGNGGTFTANIVGNGGTANEFLLANAGETLTLTLTTKVARTDTVGIGDGVIENAANVTINGKTFEPESFTRWGDVLIMKTDNAQTPRPLAGATFEVYSGACESADHTAPISVTTPDGTSASEFVSGTDGEVHIAGLWIGDENNDVTERVYCVEETEAPAGYDLANPAFQDVTVKAGTTVAANGYDATFVNPQKSPVALPLTGSTGTMAFMLGGLALMLVAGGATLIAMRRKQRQTLGE